LLASLIAYSHLDEVQAVLGNPTDSANRGSVGRRNLCIAGVFLVVLLAGSTGAIVWNSQRKRVRYQAFSEINNLDIGVIPYSSSPNWLWDLGYGELWDSYFTWSACGFQMERSYTPSELTRVVQVCKIIQPEYVFVPVPPMTHENVNELQRALPNVDIVTTQDGER